MTRVVLITGSSSGIGEAIALHQARLGNTVFATMRDPATGGQALREAMASEPLDVRILQLDVTDDASVERACAEALGQTGHIDVLVNNAGVSTIEPVEGSVAAAHELFEINYFGMLRTISAVLPSMRERGAGTIVNVSSVVGVLANAGSGAYAASKHAVEAMSESLALETVALGIRVIILRPGFIDTPIFPKAHVPYPEPPTGPYAAHIRRGLMIYSDPMKVAAPPRLVAEILEGALTDPEPKLRYHAGSADAFISARRRTPDEEWIRLGLIPEDKAWFAEVDKLVRGPGK
jgi:NAD(P)-dependent dehydrogenase (short-subunit alcohol dehydrogenase family)